MTTDEFLDELADLHSAMMSITKAKNADYAWEADPFNNFRQCEAMSICSIEQGFLVRLSDKWSRICNLIGNQKDNAVLDEKIEDTLVDMANYCLILSVYLKSKNK